MIETHPLAYSFVNSQSCPSNAISRGQSRRLAILPAMSLYFHKACLHKIGLPSFLISSHVAFPGTNLGNSSKTLDKKNCSIIMGDN